MTHADRQDRARWIASGLPDAVVTIMFRDGTLPPPHAARWYDSSLTTDEIAEVSGSLRARRGVYSSHIRNEGDGLLGALEEIVTIGAYGWEQVAFFEALAQTTGRRFIPYMLDQSLPEDLKGYPLVQDIQVNGHAARAMVHVLEEARLRAESEPAVVLLDELTCAGHSIQAAALQWVNTPSPMSWMFAAANPPDKAAAGVDLTPPMVNRLCVIPWETPVEAIRQGWRNGLEFPAPNVPIVPANWRDHLPKWGCLVDDFIQRFPDRMEAYPRDPAKAAEPYPTPRSWTAGAVASPGSRQSCGPGPTSDRGAATAARARAAG